VYAAPVQVALKSLQPTQLQARVSYLHVNGLLAILACPVCERLQRQQRKWLLNVNANLIDAQQKHANQRSDDQRCPVKLGPQSIWEDGHPDYDKA
jgi:hypothetical protein